MFKSISPHYVDANLGKWGHMMGARPEEVGYDESDGLTTNRDGGNSRAQDRWQGFKETNDPKILPRSMLRSLTSVLSVKITPLLRKTPGLPASRATFTTDCGGTLFLSHEVDHQIRELAESQRLVQSFGHHGYW